jgi:galactonate dehydratase
MWLETPVMSTDVEATIEVARQIPVPVASGERFRNKKDFARLLQSGAVDIVQPELLSVGGVMPLVKVAAIAEAFEAFVAPHNAQSPYTTVVNTHVDATLPNALIQECFDDFLVPWSHDVLTGWVTVKAGYIEVPDAPGFGVELNEAEAAKYPYADRNFLRLFESGWEKRRGDDR